MEIHGARKFLKKNVKGFFHPEIFRYFLIWLIKSSDFWNFWDFRNLFIQLHMIVLISEAAGLKWLTSTLQWTFEKYLKNFILSISCKKHTRIYVLWIKLSKNNWLIKAIQIFRQFKKGSNCLAAMHSGFSKAKVPSLGFVFWKIRILSEIVEKSRINQGLKCLKS